MLSERLKELRKKSHNLTQNEIAKKLGIAKTTYASYEQGRREPDYEMLTKISELFDVSTDYLLGNTDKPHYYSLTEKDQQDIDTELENMLNGVSKNGGINYFQNGAQISEQDRELLKASMRQTIALSKELAKKKFTPKKYRGSEQ